MTEEDLFAGASERKDPTERRAFLDAECGGDETMRRRIEALLASHEGADDFLRRPALKQLSACAVDGTTLGAETVNSRVDMEALLHLLEPAQRPGSMGRLKHYEILEVVGRGGFGTVLRGFDEKLHRVVAIKVLAAELAASAIARNRFMREARAAAAVRHEHVIDIHAVDDQPTPHLVMEYIDGQTLQQKLDRTGALPLREILRIGLQIAEGLAAAHKQGLIHRDITPSNILLENSIEKVKISDFGLARAVDDASLTQSGLIAGTPLYMSPEQAEGQPLDQRSDLFSLGSVLYALCCGRPPFRAESTLAILRRVAEDTPRPLRECNSDIPEWLASIIAELHAKKPEDRIQSAKELADLLAERLARLQTGAAEKSEIRKPTAPPNAGMQRQRLFGFRRAMAGAGVLILAALSFWFLLISPWLEKADRQTTEKANPLDRLEQADIPRALLTRIGGGDAERVAPELVAVLGDPTAPPSALNTVAFSPDGQTLAAAGADNTVRLWDLNAPQRARVLKGHTGAIGSICFSPDAKQLASASLDSTIILWDVADGKEIRTLPGYPPRSGGIAFSPDGQTLAAGGEDGKIRFWEAATGKAKDPIDAHANSAVPAVAYSPDGKFIASASLDQSVQVCDPSNGRRLFARKGNSGFLSVAYSSDGQRLAAGTTGPGATLRVWDTNTKAEHVGITAGPVHCIVFQPHGSLIATGSSNGALEFWQATEHGLRGRTVGPGPFGASLLGLAFSPDGRYIAAAGGNGLVSIYRVTAPPPTYRPGPVRTLPESKLLAEQAGLADQLKLAAGFLSLPGKTPGTLVAVLGNGAFLHKLHGVNHPVQAVIYSDDGKFLASSCGRFEPSAGQFTAWEVTLWDAASGKPLRNFPGLADMVHALAFSPDSQRLVTGCRDGTVKVWRVDSAKELLNLQGHAVMIRSAAYSPDGKLIAGSSAGDGGKVILWDAKDGSKKFTFDQPAGGALHVAFSPDSRLLAAAMAQEVHIWETATGKEVAELKVNTRPRGVAFSHDNKRLVTVGEYPASQVWDLATQHLVFELKRHANFVLAVAGSKDGAYFATGGSDQSVRLWDATNGKLLQTFFGHNGDVEGVAFHPDSKTLACGSGNGQVHVWDLATGKKLFPQHHSGPVLALAVGGDGKCIASSGADGSIRIWDLATAGLRLNLIGHQGPVSTVAVSPDGQTLASGGADWTVRLWDLADGKQLHLLAGHNDAIRQVVFAPDGKTMASASQDGTIRVWDRTTGKLLRSLEGAGACACIAFSPDGATLAAGHDSAIYLWDIASGWSAAVLRGHKGQVRSVAFHPDGQTLASAGEAADPTIRLWDLNALKQTQTWRCPAGPILSAVWRGDGRALFACGAADGTILGWDPDANATGGLVFGPLPSTTLNMRGVALTPEGRFLATANPDGTVYLFKLSDRGRVFRMIEGSKLD